jgi:hypothetical protein
MRSVRWVVAAALLAAVPPPASATARHDLLPNLVALPSVSLFVGGPGSGYVSNDDEVVYGCHPSEVANDTPTPQRCLRFQTMVANLGAGAFELHYRADEAATTRRVVQRVYANDGTYHDVPAGTYVVDPTHAHFHYEDFAVAALWRSDARGRRLGTAPLRTGRKAGFCLQDVYPYRTGGAKTYTGPTACYPARTDGGGALSQVNGVSPGWVDVYDMAVPHQYIEISGVADGYYLLQISVDPMHRLRQTTRRDDTVWQRVRLCGDKAEIVGRASACGGKSEPAPVTFGPSPHLAERLGYCALRP